MRVVSKKVLRDFWRKYEDSEHQLKTWYSKTSKAQWDSPIVVIRNFPKARVIGNNRMIFNICGNKYRLIVKFNYKRNWMFIRYIGTHKDYNKIDAVNI